MKITDPVKKKELEAATKLMMQRYEDSRTIKEEAKEQQ